MSASLHALLAGAIDYAGLFPPARLPLEEAVRHYARYRSGPDAWMLGRFVCPVARLDEITPLVPEVFGAGPPLTVSALGRGGADGAGFLDGLRADLEEVARFERGHGGRVHVDVLEARLPPLAGLRPQIMEHLARDVLMPASAVIETERQAFLTPYYEAGFEADWRESLVEVLAAFPPTAITNATHGFILCLPAGFKLRCGGLEASAFPSAEQVAFVLRLCRDLVIAFKATAGLHHPIRRFDPTVQATAHGFINLYCAGVLAHVCRLAEEQVRQVLEDEDPGHFAFDDLGLRWKDLHATTAEIARCRASAVTSFGSCSFDEPREDLRALGWLK